MMKFIENIDFELTKDALLAYFGYTTKKDRHS